MKSDDCWDWRGTINDKGTPGQTAFFSCNATDMFGQKRTAPAARFSWVIHNGPIPDGLLVCHTCDNRMCTNPEHLFLGTNKDNQQDMIRKGRGHWQRNPSKRKMFRELNFSAATARRFVLFEKRRLYQEDGWSIAMIAQKFECEQSGVFRCLDGSRHGLPRIATAPRTVTVAGPKQAPRQPRPPRMIQIKRPSRGRPKMSAIEKAVISWLRKAPVEYAEVLQ